MASRTALTAYQCDLLRRYASSAAGSSAAGNAFSWAASNTAAATAGIPLEAFREGGLLIVEGEVDPDRFAEAVRVLVAKTESLRTVIEASAAPLSAAIVDDITVDLIVYDVRDHELPEESAYAILDSEQRHPLPLFDSPLFRVSLVAVGPERWFVILIFHPIIADRSAVRAFISSLASLYGSLASDEVREYGAKVPITLEPRPIETQRSPRTHQSWCTYWRHRLNGVALAPPRPRIGKAGVGRSGWDLDRTTTDRLRARCQLLGVAPAHVVLGVTALYQMLHQEVFDTAVGIPHLGRSHGSVSCSRPPVPFRVTGEGNETLTQLVQRIVLDLRSDLRRHGLRADEIVAAPFLDRVSAAALAPMVVRFEEAERAMRFGGFVVELELFAPPLWGETAALLVTDRATEKVGHGKIDLSISYDQALFEAEEIGLIGLRWIGLIEQWLDRPDLRLSEFSLVSDLEEQQISEFTMAPWAARHLRHSVLASLREVVRDRPENLALVTPRGTLTFDEVGTEIIAMGTGLHERFGVAPEEPVVIAASEFPEWALLLLTVWSGGAAALPLPDESKSSRGSTPRVIPEQCSFVLGGNRQATPIAGAADGNVELEDAPLFIQSGELRGAPGEWYNPPLRNVAFEPPPDAEPQLTVILTHALIENCVSGLGANIGLTEVDCMLSVADEWNERTAVMLLVTLLAGAKYSYAELSEFPSGALGNELLQTTGVTWLDAPVEFAEELISRKWNGASACNLVCKLEDLNEERAAVLLKEFRSVWVTFGDMKCGGISSARRLEHVTELLILNPLPNRFFSILGPRESLAPIGFTGPLVLASDEGITSGEMVPVGARARWRTDGTLQIVRPEQEGERARFPLVFIAGPVNVALLRGAFSWNNQHNAFYYVDARAEGIVDLPVSTTGPSVTLVQRADEEFLLSFDQLVGGEGPNERLLLTETIGIYARLLQGEPPTLGPMELTEDTPGKLSLWGTTFTIELPAIMPPANRDSVRRREFSFAELEQALARRPHEFVPGGIDTWVSAEELLEQVDTIAAKLIACGLRPGDGVRVVLTENAFAVACALGVVKAGGISVPTDFDVAAEGCRFVLVSERLEEVEGDIDPAVLIIESVLDGEATRITSASGQAMLLLATLGFLEPPAAARIEEILAFELT